MVLVQGKVNDLPKRRAAKRRPLYNFHLEPELHAVIREHREINWSEIARAAFRDAAAILEKQKRRAK
jgi:hypothetical protein